MTTLATALQMARERIPAAEARLLLGHLLRATAAWIEAHRTDELDAAAAESFASLVARRHRGEPIAYITGQREFYGRVFHVTPAVLIPRPETELLVESVLERCAGLARPHILELGTGSGCVAITLALERPDARVTALDLSTAALAVAAANAGRLGARVAFLAGDWLSAIGASAFDVLVSNPPYVAADDPHLRQGDLAYEPVSALVGGIGGLEAIRNIVASAPDCLRPDGWLQIEHGWNQAAPVSEILATTRRFGKVQGRRDLAGILRVCEAQYEA